MYLNVLMAGSKLPVKYNSQFPDSGMYSSCKYVEEFSISKIENLADSEMTERLHMTRTGQLEASPGISLKDYVGGDAGAPAWDISY
jgi:hypothetical protein